MVDLAVAYPAFAAAGVTVWGVSVDPPRAAALLKAEEFLPFDLLCDVERIVTRTYGLLNTRERDGVPIPALVAVGQNRNVLFVAIDRMARQTKPATVLEAIGAGPPVGGGGRRWLRPRIRDLLKILRRRFRASG